MQHRLPNGDVVEDELEYVQAWKTLISKVEGKLPSYRAGGFDPGILLHPKGSDTGSFTLPVRAALDLCGECFENDQSPGRQSWD